MSQDLRNTIAKNVRLLRNQSGKTQYAMSIWLGFDFSYISKLEKGTVNITIDRLAKIAEFFGVEPYELLK